MVGAGKLDVYVMIQEQTDPGGDRTLYTDATGGEIWINLRPLKGQERFLAQAINGRITHRATCRYWPGLTGAHRFKRKDTGRIVELLSDPLEVDRGAWFEIDVCEHEDAGD